jgi:hypothetical protein
MRLRQKWFWETMELNKRSKAIATAKLKSERKDKCQVLVLYQTFIEHHFVWIREWWVERERPFPKSHNFECIYSMLLLFTSSLLHKQAHLHLTYDWDYINFECIYSMLLQWLYKLLDLDYIHLVWHYLNSTVEVKV